MQCYRENQNRLSRSGRAGERARDEPLSETSFLAADCTGLIAMVWALDNRQLGGGWVDRRNDGVVYMLCFVVFLLACAWSSGKCEGL